MGLNYTCIFQGVKNTCKFMEMMKKTKEWAMQSLGFKGKHGEHGKLKQYPSLTTKMHLNSKSNGAQALIHHLITTWKYTF